MTKWIFSPAELEPGEPRYSMTDMRREYNSALVAAIKIIAENPGLGHRSLIEKIRKLEK